MLRDLKAALRGDAASWPSGVLTIALLAMAGLVIGIALTPRAPVLKAAVLAWIVLP